jgi:methionyl-tRNA formyltransferase
MPGHLSRAPLWRLVEGGAEVCAVVIPKTEGSPERLKAEIDPNALMLQPASSFFPPGLPVMEVASLNAPETLAALSALMPDVICVACFPFILPPALLSLPPLGCLNLHPSLLPAYRGPAPLFWQFRQGEARTGVTVHFMDEGVDTGDIALQQPVGFPDGVSGAEADRLCGEAGAELMVEAVRLLGQGRCPRRKQNGDDPSPSLRYEDLRPGRLYARWPRAVDFEISTEWPARRAFNFVRGTAHWGVPYTIDVGDATLRVGRALGLAPGEGISNSWQKEGKNVWVALDGGAILFEIVEA